MPCFNLVNEIGERTPPSSVILSLFYFLSHWCSITLRTQPFLLILPSPPSINIGLYIPLIFLYFCMYTFFSGLVDTHCHFSACLAANKIVFNVFLPQNSIGGVFVQHSPTLPSAMLPLGDLPFHSVIWNHPWPAVSSLSCACSLLETEPECLMPHASKYNPYPVPELCIHFPHTAHPIHLPVHGRKRN